MWHYMSIQTDSGAQPVSYTMGTRGSLPGIKRPGREADNSPPSSIEVKNAWNYTSIHPIRYAFMAWCSVKARWQLNLYITFTQKSRGSSVGIVQSYGLDDRGSRVRFSVGAGNFSVHHCVQNGSGAHPASSPMGTRGSFPGGKAAGSWS
jgi:hypothetical protein